MQSHPSESGQFFITVTLQSANDSKFQIVRNRDWHQCFYPSSIKFSRGDGAESPEVSGPDDLSYGRSWCIDGVPGDIFRIDFRRTIGHESDVRTISWQKVGHRELDK